MPIRTLSAEAIRREIAETAAEATGSATERYLGLLGPVEMISSGDRSYGWRLSHYLGSPEEHDAIERAIGTVQRRHPLMRTG
jgi:hypothetical protein